MSKTAKDIQDTLNSLMQDYQVLSDQLETFENKQNNGHGDFSAEIQSYKSMIEDVEDRIAMSQMM